MMSKLPQIGDRIGVRYPGGRSLTGTVSAVDADWAAWDVAPVVWFTEADGYENFCHPGDVVHILETGAVTS